MNAAICGAGQSAVGRRLGRAPLDLTVEACLRAIEDAGLSPRDIDGLAAYPGRLPEPPGFSGPSTHEVAGALGLRLEWYGAGHEGPGQLGAVVAAAAAVATGLARWVLVYRTVTEGSAGGGSLPPGRGRVSGPLAWLLPFGAFSAAHWIALQAQRHMHLYGTTRRHLAAVALAARRWAAANPSAVYRHPLTMEEYLQAPIITTPFCLYDCDVPCDGSTAFVVGRHGGVRIAAAGTALRSRPYWDQWDEPGEHLRDAAEQLWRRTALRPSDIDVAQLYDGFSFLVIAWAEALGLCPRGQGGGFVEEGSLPINTGGGQLSGGRLHGFGLLYEAVLQLRGQAGERQVPGAEVAVVAAGGGPVAGCLLLTR